MKIKAGTTLILEHGEYSDYTFAGPFRVLKDFDQAEVCAEFRAQWKPDPQEDWRDSPSEYEFIGWISKAGYVEDVPAHKWHIGSYRFDPSIQTEPADPQS
jgi:hypothetical protein